VKGKASRNPNRAYTENQIFPDQSDSYHFHKPDREFPQSVNDRKNIFQYLDVKVQDSD
jgi:hypothetical protein